MWKCTPQWTCARRTQFLPTNSNNCCGNSNSISHNIYGEQYEAQQLAIFTSHKVYIHIIITNKIS